MQISVDIPKGIADQLRAEWSDLSLVLKESLAIEGYRTEKLSIGQVAELLGRTVYEAEGFMKQRGVTATYSLEDFEEDQATVARVLGR